MRNNKWNSIYRNMHNLHLVIAIKCHTFIPSYEKETMRISRVIQSIGIERTSDDMFIAMLNFGVFAHRD